MFALLALNWVVWSITVLFYINADTVSQAQFWLSARLAVVGFLPATLYAFAAVFPKHRFDGSKVVLVLNMLAAPAFIAVEFPGWHGRVVRVMPGHVPEAVYGPALYVYLAWALFTIVSFLGNLVRKWKQRRGIERRQVEHVLVGMTLTVVLAMAATIIAPLLGRGSVAVYGPVCALILAGFAAYSMIRYRLLEMSVLLMRAGMYIILTAFVAGAFVVTVSLVQWAFTFRGSVHSDILAVVLAALVVAVVLQPLKERLRLLLDRALIKRRYDTNRLLGQISDYVANLGELDDMLKAVFGDIQVAVGTSVVRVVLVDEEDERAEPVVEYDSRPGENEVRTRDFRVLLDFLEQNQRPLELEKMLHARLDPESMQTAALLAENDIFLLLPLRMTRGLIGFLALGPKKTGDIYSREDLAVFNAIAGPLAAAIENARLHRRLTRLNLHLTRILSTMRGGVVAIDRTGEVTTVNPRAKSILGHVEPGMPYTDLLPQLARLLEAALRERRAVNEFETTVSRPDGEDIPVVLSSACLEAGNGEPVGALVMLYDLSEIRRLERQVERADRLSSIGILAAGMAHEIKNPLASIKSFTQMLLNRYDEPEFRQALAAVVPGEVERIDAIVGRLLDFARPTQGGSGPADVCNVMETVLALSSARLKKGNIRVQKYFPGHKACVMADRQQLHQVFLNLVLNAIDAMEGDGEGVLSLRVSLERRRLGRTAGGIPGYGVKCLCTYVEDTGCGMDKADFDRVFTPFYTTKDSGQGLGLSVAHSIVVELGGTIDVTSQAGNGATFVVVLPVAETAAGDRAGDGCRAVVETAAGNDESS